MPLDIEKEIIDQLGKNYLCYVLLTCSQSSDDGKMNVEMNYEGDPLLASYLLQGAQALVDKDVEPQ